MQKTRREWISIQANLPMTEEATDLWELIEGKKWSTSRETITIVLTPEQVDLVRQAEAGQASISRPGSAALMN